MKRINLVALAFTILFSQVFAGKYEFSEIKDVGVEAIREQDSEAVIVFRYATEKEYLPNAKAGDIILFEDGREFVLKDKSQEIQDISDQIDRKEIERQRERFASF